MGAALIHRNARPSSQQAGGVLQAIQVDIGSDNHCSI
jgi:hypothetical protein